MKALFLTIIVSINWAHARSSADFGKKWKLVRDNDIAIVWKARRVPSVFASVSIVKRKSNMNLYKNRSYLKELLGKRKKMLKLSGVSHWKVKRHRWIKGKDGRDSLSFEGNYKDHQGKSVTFHEVHKFSEVNVTQILYTNLGTRKVDGSLKHTLFMKYGVKL